MSNYLVQLLKIAGVKLTSFQLWLAQLILEAVYKYLKPIWVGTWEKIKGKRKAKKVTEARENNDKDAWRKSIDDL